MKKFLLILFLFPSALFAQIVVEQGIGFMFIQQRGFVFREADPMPLFPQTVDVGRYLAPFGGTFTFFMPFDMVSIDNPKHKFGGQTGVGFYYTNKNKSMDLNYIPDPAKSFFARSFGVLHVPLLIAFRSGSSLNPEKGVPGFSIAAGMDAMYFSIADEKGIALIPTSNFTFCKGKNGIRAGFYHLKFKSVFKSNAGEVVRLKTSFFQVEVFHSF